VLIESTEPISTKDGVTVAKHFEIKQRNKNIGVRLIKSVAGSTNESAGDGTTTSTILASEFVKLINY